VSASASSAPPGRNRGTNPFSTGSAPPAYRRAALHPWLHPCAPLGRRQRHAGPTAGGCAASACRWSGAVTPAPSAPCVAYCILSDTAFGCTDGPYPVGRTSFSPDGGALYSSTAVFGTVTPASTVGERRDRASRFGAQNWKATQRAIGACAVRAGACLSCGSASCGTRRGSRTGSKSFWTQAGLINYAATVAAAISLHGPVSARVLSQRSA
jgi:hypothetical protein